MTPKQKIERAFQRAMNIGDSTPARASSATENRYAKAYRRAYKHDDVESLKPETRRYLKRLRASRVSS